MKILNLKDLEEIKKSWWYNFKKNWKEKKEKKRKEKYFNSQMDKLRKEFNTYKNTLIENGNIKFRYSNILPFVNQDLYVSFFIKELQDAGYIVIEMYTEGAIEIHIPKNKQHSLLFGRKKDEE